MYTVSIMEAWCDFGKYGGKTAVVMSKSIATATRLAQCEVDRHPESGGTPILREKVITAPDGKVIFHSR